MIESEESKPARVRFAGGKLRRTRLLRQCEQQGGQEQGRFEDQGDDGTWTPRRLQTGRRAAIIREIDQSDIANEVLSKALSAVTYYDRATRPMNHNMTGKWTSALTWPLE